MIRTQVDAVKHIPRILTVILGLFFVTVLIYSVQSTVSLSRTFSSVGTEGEARDFHVAVFVPDAASLFLERLINGAHGAATEYGIALTVHSIDNDALSLKMAKYSGIDGAILYPSMEEAETRRRLDELDRAGVSVVLIEQGVADDWPWTFVGTNNFDVGRRIGELVASDAEEPVHLAVVYSDKSPGVNAEKELVELGINVALGPALAAPVIRKRTGLNPLDAENLTYQILRTMPHVNTIAFTDSADTLAAIQVIIDLNLVGSVRIIGFGSTGPIQDYLERGILAGTIVVNPERIGSEAVRTLSGLIRDGSSPGYVDTGVEIIRGAP
jgi:ribose transport system substrate-binding protein